MEDKILEYYSYCAILYFPLCFSPCPQSSLMCAIAALLAKSHFLLPKYLLFSVKEPEFRPACSSMGGVDIDSTVTQCVMQNLTHLQK